MNGERLFCDEVRAHNSRAVRPGVFRCIRQPRPQRVNAARAFVVRVLVPSVSIELSELVMRPVEVRKLPAFAGPFTGSFDPTEHIVLWRSLDSYHHFTLVATSVHCTHATQ